MANLQTLGQKANGRAAAPAIESFYRQQQLVLLRLQAEGPRGGLAEMLKFPYLVAEFRERPELSRRYVFGPLSGTVQQGSP